MREKGWSGLRKWWEMAASMVSYWDPTVTPDWRRKGIGRQLVEACAEEARRKGVEWLHVDYEPHLKEFYQSCGFSPAEAGLRNLRKDKSGEESK